MHGFIFGSVESDTGRIQDFLIAKGSILQSRWGFDLFIVPDYLLFFPEFSEMSMEFE